jgi:hypothetical protein
MGIRKEPMATSQVGERRLAGIRPDTGEPAIGWRASGPIPKFASTRSTYDANFGI